MQENPTDKLVRELKVRSSSEWVVRAWPTDKLIKVGAC